MIVAMGDKTNFERVMEGLAEVLDINEGRAAPGRIAIGSDADFNAAVDEMGALLGRDSSLTPAEVDRCRVLIAAAMDWQERNCPDSGAEPERQRQRRSAASAGPRGRRTAARDGRARRN